MRTASPKETFFQRRSGAHALMNLPYFGSGAAYDSKGHFSSPAANLPEQTENGLVSAPSDNCGLEKTPNCYTHFRVHASFAILLKERFFLQLFFTQFS
jgi:hypothetical protein